MEKRLADTDGIHIYGWMRNVLHLTGGELITFAIVFRSSQSQTGIYTGGIPYVADFIGCSKETARKYLHALEDRGLIEGEDIDKNGVHYRNYQVIDNHIPKNFGYIPKKIVEDTQEMQGGIPKKFGSKEYNKAVVSNNPPTPQEVAAYCRSRGFADPEGFADLFIENCNNNGWRSHGGQGAPITNWKNYIVNSWERNHKNRTYLRATSVANAPVQVNKEKLDNYLR